MSISENTTFLALSLIHISRSGAEVLPTVRRSLILWIRSSISRPFSICCSSSAMAEIGTEAEQRKQFITETEHRIAELEQQIEKGLSLIHIFRMPENMLKELAGYDCTYAIEIQAEAEYQEIIEQRCV